MLTTIQQLDLFQSTPSPEAVREEIAEILNKADRILIGFSGGKDSLCCVLDLIDRGYKEKIELHHHLIDGASNEPTFFDWKITEDYCRAVARHLNLPIYFSYTDGGFKREMLRNEQPTAPVYFEKPDGSWGTSGGNGNPGYRMKFPMPTGNLSIRWCSSALKISVMDGLIRNQPRFDGKITVVVTGERREESPQRSKYKQIEPHRINCKSRTLYHYRPVIDWETEEIWARIEKSGIVPHPSYYLNYGRCSCATCIFQSNDELATYNEINPDAIAEITAYEKQFNCTISYDKKRTKQLNTAEKVALGKSYKFDPLWAELAMSATWDYPIYLTSDKWRMPPGARASLLSGSF